MSSLDTFFAQFVRERIYLNNVTPRTREWYESAWKAFSRFQRTEPPRSPDGPLITRTDLQRFVIHLRERGVKPVSCNCWLKAMNAFCGWLHAQGILAEPLSLRPQKLEKRLLRLHSQSAIRTLLHYKPKDYSHWRITIGVVLKAAAALFLGGDLPYRMFPFVLVDFLGGALAYRYRFALVRLLGRNARAAAYAGMLIIVAGIPSSFTTAQVSSLALVLTIFTVPALFDATKKNVVDALLGELSYPFYIFHVLCLDMVGFVLQRLGVATSGVLASTTLGATLFVSYILVRLELRFLEPWRKRLGHEPAGIVLAFKAGEPKHGIVRSEQV
jgi:hypothetical protein